jgi:putative DNA primase/helicase
MSRFEIEKARAVPIEAELARRGVPLQGRGPERAGPCPACGGADRFSINTAKQVWNCRGCEAKGKGTIDLVKFLDGCNFLEAVETIAGEPRPGAAPKKVVAERFDYHDETGTLLYQIERVEFRNPDGSFVLADGGKRKKTFRQRRPDPDRPGQWLWNLDGVAPVPYRLPELIDSLDGDHLIIIAEGERKVDFLRGWGFAATCNSGGSKKWRAEHSAFLRGANVVILPDKDPPGRKHLDAVAASVKEVGAAVRVLTLPGLPPKGDVVDWAEAGGTTEQLRDLIQHDARPWASSSGHDAEPAAMASQPEAIVGDGVEGGDVAAISGNVIWLSEDTLALVFADRHASGLRYVAAWGKWLAWTGTHWEIESTLAVYDMARKICRGFVRPNASPPVLLTKAQTVSAIEMLARSDRRIAATAEQWDADPWELNTPGGIVDLRTGLIRPHCQQTDYVMKITGAAPAETADCTVFLQFVNEITQGDSEYIAYLQRLAGYCLTGDTSEHVLAFAHGPGGGGKTTYFDALGGAMGSYRTVAAMETFVQTGHREHYTELANLAGARMVTASETEEGRLWAEAKIKNLTGGDPISARFMHKDFFEFRPQFKLMIFGNHRPGLRSVDEAIRRRFHLLPFPVSITDEKRDPNLPAKLKAEWPGILRWATEGCLQWQRQRLKPPAAVVEATRDYLSAEDNVRNWIEDSCTVAASEWEASGALFASWKKWAEASGVIVGTERSLVQAIKGKLGNKVAEKRVRDMASKKRGLVGISVNRGKNIDAD